MVFFACCYQSLFAGIGPINLPLWQFYHEILEEWFYRNAKWKKLILITKWLIYNYNSRWKGGQTCVCGRESEGPQIKPKHQLSNASEMSSVVQLMISKNTSLPFRSLSWIWCEDLTTKDQQTDQLKEQSPAQISRFHTTPDLLHF